MRSQRFEQATGLCALLAATKRAAKGKRHLLEVARFVMDAERRCLQLQEELRAESGSAAAWKPGPARTFRLFDPKPRLIAVVPFADRVVHHALCQVVEPEFERFAIKDSYACRKGKGQHAAILCGQRYAAASRDGFYFKGDVKAYFASIPHERLIEVLKRRVKEPDVREVLERIICAYPSEEGRGLPIGALTSQHLANLYLGVLDHYVKDDLGVRRYLRYMDDFVAFGSRQEMLSLRERVREFLQEKLGLALNEKTSRVQPVRDGVPMLGLRVYPAMVRVSQPRWRRFRKKQEKLEGKLRSGACSEEEVAQRVASQYAHLEKWNTYRLRRAMLKKLAEARTEAGGS